ncbi:MULTISPECIES: UbiA-like polyprenyltransferase [Desulfosporosinus]|uniref:4-hydroxybenzoate polyprenyltransferase n=2 Tax=Desulfosporosinus TaxID=79206 RepID=A0A1M5XIB2_9FIRM|nr:MULTISPECIES: UbiA-like polyprenyltransferase [Desulfosporosinus]MCO1601856.1 putative 4-hydroxybenzoate polyprenyltransferase [Desulfosporosinus nitroreducens]MDO0823410.1 putative 4-hydroxybenzoate polyprenyltransferase [Desulfosporosinus nitroreducens]SHH99557.1 4-hydroxybenzoate polyprenyltransferase [Desulfosporosinus lacus DSM 15449]
MHKLKVFFEMIKFEHTIFALPFAYLGAFLAAEGIPSAMKLLWITLAMVGARTAAMSLNRLVDRHIDARNPRTAQRALPAGQLRVDEVYLYVVFSFLLLGISAYQLNLLALYLMPIAVFFLVLYSYTKRFTWACHLVLGISLGLAPAGAWIGITGHWALAPVLLGLGVMTWVAGFDVVYACQDVEFDRKEGLHSIPAVFGLQRGLEISAFLHTIAPLLFIAVGVVMSLSWLYYAGVAIAIVLLFRQHRLVSADDFSKIGVAFFDLNGYLSILLFVFSVLDIILLS